MLRAPSPCFASNPPAGRGGTRLRRASSHHDRRQSCEAASAVAQWPARSQAISGASRRAEFEQDGAADQDRVAFVLYRTMARADGRCELSGYVRQGSPAPPARGTDRTLRKDISIQATAIARQTSAAPGVRAWLRTTTDAIHLALHDADPFARIAAGALDRAGYARLLAVLARFHGALAPVIAMASATLDSPDLAVAAERRRHRLADDLAALGSPQIGSAPAVAPLGPAWSVGCLYTVLGSTLGGKVIHRQLEYLLVGDEGRSFVAGSRGDGAHWRGFCARMDEYGARGDRASAIGAGAHFAFAHFAACLDEY